MNFSLTPSDINQTFVIESPSLTGGTPVISACTAIYTNNIISCSGNSEIILASGTTIFNTDLTPTIDSNIDLGSTLKRFRNINTVSGNSTVWTSSVKVITPMLDLGIDSGGNVRQITANNSIIQNDELNSGVY